MNRFVSLFAALAAVLFASPTFAVVTFEESKDGKPAVIRMTVTPAAEPMPSLRYRLVPRELDQKTGNAAPYYYRAVLAYQSARKSIREKFDQEKELDLWYNAGENSTPIAELATPRVREASRMFDPVYDNQLKFAFERKQCDWQLDLGSLRGPQLFAFDLEEFQESRALARMMSLRTRLAIADKQYDEAVVLMRQMYQLGGDVAKVPFLVCGIIGIAIDEIANRSIIELIAASDSPNMYWALGQLPRPPIDLQPAVLFEMNFGPRVFPFMHNAETTDRSPQEWNRLFRQAMDDLRNMGGAPPGNPEHSSSSEFRAGLAATTLGLAGYTHAKSQLIAQGIDRDKVEKMSVGQVIAIYTERNYRSFTDEWERAWQLPFADSMRKWNELEKRLRDAQPFGISKNREILPVLTLLLPALQASRHAEARLERDVAALQVIEALRLYAATHDSKLPTRLEEITEVPVPHNPATAKPFLYHLDEDVAILELPPSDRLSSGNVRYEIKIAPRSVGN